MFASLPAENTCSENKKMYFASHKQIKDYHFKRAHTDVSLVSIPEIIESAAFIRAETRIDDYRTLYIEKWYGNIHDILSKYASYNPFSSQWNLIYMKSVNPDEPRGNLTLTCIKRHMEGDLINFKIYKTVYDEKYNSKTYFYNIDNIIERWNKSFIANGELINTNDDIYLQSNAKNIYSNNYNPNVLGRMTVDFLNEHYLDEYDQDDDNDYDDNDYDYDYDDVDYNDDDDDSSII